MSLTGLRSFYKNLFQKLGLTLPTLGHLSHVPTCRETQREVLLFLRLHHGSKRHPGGPQGVAAHVMSPKRTSHARTTSTSVTGGETDNLAAAGQKKPGLFSTNDATEPKTNQQVLTLAALQYRFHGRRCRRYRKGSAAPPFGEHKVPQPINLLHLSNSFIRQFGRLRWLGCETPPVGGRQAPTDTTFCAFVFWAGQEGHCIPLIETFNQHLCRVGL